MRTWIGATMMKRCLNSPDKSRISRYILLVPVILVLLRKLCLVQECYPPGPQSNYYASLLREIYLK